MDIELVVFDMAGTTVAEGGAVHRCLRDTCAAYGVPVTDADIRPVKGLDKRDALRTLVTASSRHDELLPQLEGIHHDFVGTTEVYVSSYPGPGASRMPRREGQRRICSTRSCSGRGLPTICGKNVVEKKSVSLRRCTGSRGLDEMSRHNRICRSFFGSCQRSNRLRASPDCRMMLARVPALSSL